MLLLNCSRKLASLEKLLLKNFPESLKERIDDLDSYTNSYYMFTQDMKGLHEILENTDSVDWTQVLQIQGLQSGLDEVIRSTAATKKVKVETAKRLLYVKEESLIRCLNSEHHATFEKPVQPAKITVCKSGLQHVFQFSSLSPSYAELVNAGWGFGQTEKSLRYIQRCLRLLPSACLLDAAGNPSAVGLMDQSAELRMGYTLPEYRRMGLFMHLLWAFEDSLAQPDLPFYLHMAEGNKLVKGSTEKAGYRYANCGWYQWNCQPLRSVL
ncbi:glycine N-phenylacetyltransferase-like isoform X3 [Ambystoma mexicanum]|uniref:glycine N-phenylacetyltransferase-like isoform X3 n=1 Tax=Ambystoma mexicanum TaxID=8296 RepID=UPI0037E775AD